MKYLGRLIVLFTAALALGNPVPAQADPGINALYSDGWIELDGRTVCSWTRQPVNGGPPPGGVIIPLGTDLNCTNGYWGGLNQDLSSSFDDTAGTATVQVVDITGGALFFWCRYVKSNVVLTRTPGTREYTGSYSVPLHSSNWPSQCSNPGSIRIWIKFYEE